MTIAAYYEGERSFSVGTAVPADPGPGEVAIDVAYTGVCGTDLHIYHGHMDHRVARHQVIGHELSGTVAAVGPDVGGLAPGDRVVVMPLDWCGECRPCRRGTHNICYNLHLLGIDTPGSMQERWIAPARVVFPVPAHVPLDLAALVEPLAVAVHDVSRGGVRSGDRVVVIGGGPVGQLIALVARERGAEVVVSEPDEYRRGFAGESGFTTIDPTATDLAGWVAEWTGGEGADVAFEVSATIPGARAMTDVLAGRGTAVAVGIYPQPPPVDLFRFFWRELSLIGARVYADEDFAAAIDLVAAGSLPLDRFVTAVYPLEQAADAFVRLEAGGGLMKVLIDSRRDRPGTR